jgi:hypothetical protein
MHADRVLIGGPQTEEGLRAVAELVSVYERWARPLPPALCRGLHLSRMLSARNRATSD